MSGRERGTRTLAPGVRAEEREGGGPGRMRTSGRGRGAHAGLGGASAGHVLPARAGPFPGPGH